MLDILLINPPYLTLTSTRGVGHQVPLGLLLVGGSLLDAGFSVQLLDAEAQHLSHDRILSEIRLRRPRIVMTGHAGSTAAHTACVAMLRAIKHKFPHVITVYGGPFPTYHAAEILTADGPAGCESTSRDAVDIIVRGEGEATAVALARALLHDTPLDRVQSIAFLDEGRVRITPERPPLDLNDTRVAWELLDENKSWDDYQCFGLGRAVIVQLSRGCPHACTYCGQRGFWMKWRHRDPVVLADEIEWLARNRGVRFITLADENPTTLRGVWETFLKEVARRNLPMKFFATIRATDIVRDADSIPLWHAAGIQYVLLGIDATDAETIRTIRKGSTTRTDFRACQLLRDNHIFVMIGHIVGLAEETPRHFWRAFRQLALYDGDYLNAMYVTPHAWTAFAHAARHRTVVDENLAHWDYRHPVLGQATMRPWQSFLAVKILEAAFHLRPRRLMRLLTTSAFSRRQFAWGLLHISHVWLAEIRAFCTANPRTTTPRPLADFFPTTPGEHHHTVRLTSLRTPPGRPDATVPPQTGMAAMAQPRLLPAPGSTRSG